MDGTLAAFAVAGATVAFVAVQHVLSSRQLAASMPPLPVLAAVLASLLTDTVRVGAVLVRALAGRPCGGDVRWQAFHPDGQSADDVGRRALVTVLVSMAPNGFVLDLRPSALPEADGGLLLHRLTPGPPLSGRDWPA